MCSGILEPDPQDYLFLGGLLIGSKGEIDELGWGRGEQAHSPPRQFLL